MLSMMPAARRAAVLGATVFLTLATGCPLSHPSLVAGRSDPDGVEHIGPAADEHHVTDVPTAIDVPEDDTVANALDGTTDVPDDALPDEPVDDAGGPDAMDDMDLDTDTAPHGRHPHFRRRLAP